MNEMENLLFIYYIIYRRYNNLLIKSLKKFNNSYRVPEPIKKKKTIGYKIQ